MNLVRVVDLYQVLQENHIKDSRIVYVKVVFSCTERQNLLRHPMHLRELRAIKNLVDVNQLSRRMELRMYDLNVHYCVLNPHQLRLNGAPFTWV
jgi:hypothetical protein